MGVRLRLLNFWLRLFAKTALRRMQEPDRLRRRFERDAARFFVVPDGAHFADALIRRPAGCGPAGWVPAVWASRGRPDRRKVVLYLHGGAYLAGSPRTHRHLAAALAGAAGVRALVPDYRLAPEHPFPAALEDAQASYAHLLDSGYDAGEIALAGESAGGGLAFALLLRLRMAGLPAPRCVVAFSPWADMTGRRQSLRRNAQRDVMLPARRLPEVVRLYLGDHDPADPLASPALAEWHDPPPALIMASRSEILLDDAIALSEALRRGDGDVRLELWQGVPHAWPIFAGLIGEADRAVARAGTFIARHLGLQPERAEEPA